MDMENPTGDGRFDPKTEITRNSDGSWKAKDDKIRMNVFTSTGYDKNQINTIDHAPLDQKGYMQSPNDWKNVEITGYVKVNQIKSEDNFAWYARGGFHGDEEPCEGVSYKVDLFYGSEGGTDAQVAKEQWHVEYSKTDARPTGIPALEGKWTGFKAVIYNIQQPDGKTAVKTEGYVDEGGTGDNWNKVFEETDAGGWGRTGTDCGKEPDQIISWGGPVATFRWDNAPDVDIKNLSIREISAGGAVDTAVPTLTTPSVPTLTPAPTLAPGPTLMPSPMPSPGLAPPALTMPVPPTGPTAPSAFPLTTPPPLTAPLPFSPTAAPLPTVPTVPPVPSAPLNVTSQNVTRLNLNPSVSINNNYVYAVWANKTYFANGTGSGTDIVFTSSNNSGANFSRPITLSHTPEVNITKVSTKPQISSNGSYVAIVWGEKISERPSEIISRISQNHGSTFGDWINITNLTNNFIINKTKSSIPLFSGLSAGNTTSAEVYDLPPTTARYLTIEVNGSIAADNTAGVTDLRVRVPNVPAALPSLPLGKNNTTSSTSTVASIASPSRSSNVVYCGALFAYDCPRFCLRYIR